MEVRKLRRLAIKLLAGALLLFLLGYIYLFKLGGALVPSADYSEEVLRIPSPDSVVDAVLMKTNGGATTSFGYELYIVPSGRKPQKGSESFNADHLDGMNVLWKQTRLLEIQYREGRIFRFTNFWQSKDVENFHYVVELRLVPLTPSFSLSPRDRWVDSH